MNAEWGEMAREERRTEGNQVEVRGEGGNLGTGGGKGGGGGGGEGGGGDEGGRRVGEEWGWE